MELCLYIKEFEGHKNFAIDFPKFPRRIRRAGGTMCIRVKYSYRRVVAFEPYHFS